MKARVAAAKVIAEVLQKKASLNSLLPNFINQVASQDQGLFKELCFGTLRWYPRIEVVLNHLLAKPFKQKDSDLQALLASAIYQLEHTRIPAHAAINEAVSATKPLKKAWAKGLVNGVLRNYQRSASSFDEMFSQNPCYTSAHPQWLIDCWQAAWPDQLAGITVANNQRPPMTLRVNASKTTRTDYAKQLNNLEITNKPTNYSDQGLNLETAADISQLPHFNEGYCSVQDEAAQLCVSILKPRSGESVLDACCAPGGKLGHLLEAMNYQGTLHGVEMDSERLVRVEENITRLTANTPLDHLNLELFNADAADTASWWDGKPYNKILLDAPCSATGVIRRNPDIKLLRSMADINKLAKLQLEILSSLWPLLETGGQLLYATCSSLPMENDQVIANFVEHHDNAKVQPIEGNYGISTAFGRQLFPQINGHDGFYYALLQKLDIS